MNVETDTRQSTVVLLMSTLAFGVCFACWMVNATLVTFLNQKGVFVFDDGQVGWLLAVPILAGALSRPFLGVATDRFGGRVVFSCLLLLVALPMVGLAYATSYAQFVWASLAFGFTGGSFAVGVAAVSRWYSDARQGTALGIFGVGNTGAAASTMLTPVLLDFLTDDGATIEGWRRLPLLCAALLALTGVAYWVLVPNRRAPQARSLRAQLGLLRNPRVWRFGFYYFLVFGGFVTLAQWMVPYSVNVYGLSLVSAGLLAAAFSLPSGVLRAVGGWLSDRYGPRRVTRGVFQLVLLASVLLAIPRMQILATGAGVSARAPGAVTAVSADEIRVGSRAYPLRRRPPRLAADRDDGAMVLPRVATWHEAKTQVGEQVVRKQLLAAGLTTIYYPANLWLFAFFVLVLGATTGIGMASVYKFIPDHFPNEVGAVGGMVGLLGAMGGFVLPPVFAWLLQGTGLWSSCWLVMALLTVLCLTWMNSAVRRMDTEGARQDPPTA